MRLLKYYKFYGITLLLAVFFFYGLLVGKYEVFPYQIIVSIKNAVSHQEQIQNKYENVEIIESSLQRLLVKSVELNKGLSADLVESGGAIGSIDNIVYLSPNRRDENKGKLIVLNIVDNFEYDSNELRVPMNYSEMIELYGSALDNFSTKWFRVNGIHLEKNIDNRHDLYVTHNKFNSNEKCISFNVSQISLEINRFTVKKKREWNTIFEADRCIPIEYDENESKLSGFAGQMSGGGIAKYGDKHLLISIGDHGYDGRDRDSLPMDSNSSFGKIILLNKKTGSYKIYASGFRNPQGLHVDSNNRVWATDHGPQAGDELNLILEDANYGWPNETYGIWYGNNPWPFSEFQGRHDAFEKPKLAWLPSIAPSSILGIEGIQTFSLWQNDLIIGTLKEKSLYRVRLANDQIQYSEKIEIGQRIRDMTTTKDGKIILLTDIGSIMIIEDGGPVYNNIDEKVENKINMLAKFDNLNPKDFNTNSNVSKTLSGRQIFIQKCSNCHNLDKVNGVGPHLNNLFDRNIGVVDEFNYSPAFLEKNENWNPELLKSFLLEPDSKFPNSKMLKIDINEDEVNRLTKFLGNSK